MNSMITNERIEELALKSGIGIFPLQYTREKEKYYKGDHINLLYQFARNIIQEANDSEKSVGTIEKF
ncbi:hypothetical protein UFOVP116_90 [uncultured Caudovirales phage]|uniref:Uncharacterized protein n=1 Tax=uncultured Caudovirales phage TaxID=2100421 RepID=A0A6J5L8F4_9CAUD|nr:hypothetical protein UFOVP116_90 [uncultured Caudovirales phage]